MALLHSYTSYNVANGRHILVGVGSHRNVNRINDFSNTTRLVINPIKQLSITGDFTFRFTSCATQAVRRT